MISNNELIAPNDEQCAEIRALMLEEETRRLSPLESRRIEVHVLACTGCQELLHGAYETAPDDLVREHAPVPPSTEEWGSVEAALRAAPLPGGKTVIPVQWFGLAAAVVLVGTLLFWFLDLPSAGLDDHEAYVADVSVDILEVPEESRVMVDLPDEEGGAIMVWISSG